MLDADEYLHLAIHASSMGEHHASMTYLKEALEREPANGRALYLLAVQHAELGLQERAIRELKAVLDIEPAMELARFQLGLLLLDRRRPAEAKQEFARLETTRDESLRTCCEALSAFADNDLLTAKEKLAAALAKPLSNPALTVMMQKLLEAFSGQPSGRAAEAQPKQVHLGAYAHSSR